MEEKRTKKRSKLTLWRQLYDQAKKQSDADRLAIYDAVLGYGFDGKDIEYSKLSDNAERIVIEQSIEINKMKKQYENGCAEKTNFSDHAFGCGKNKSQNMPDFEQFESLLYNYIYNNYKNFSIKSVSQSKTDACSGLAVKAQTLAHAPAENENPAKSNAPSSVVSVANALAEVLEPVKASAPTVYERVASCLREICKKTTPMNINGYATAPGDILKHILDSTKNVAPELLRSALETIFIKIDNQKVHNKINYEAAAMYNISQALPDKINYTDAPMRKKKVNDEFETRQYTKEQLNSLIDNIDDLVIDDEVES